MPVAKLPINDTGLSVKQLLARAEEDEADSSFAIQDRYFANMMEEQSNESGSQDDSLSDYDRERF